MSLVSYSCSTDSEDEDNNNKQRYQNCKNEVSTKYNISMKKSNKENISTDIFEIERKRNKVIIPAFNFNNNNNDAYYEKNIKPKCTKNHSSLLDILPVPKWSQNSKLGDSKRKQSKLIPINALNNFENNHEKCETDDVKNNNDFIFSINSSNKIYSLNNNANNVTSRKNKFNLSTSTSNNTAAENITSINLSENQYKRLKKDDSYIRNINVTDMLEYQKWKISKNSTEEFCQVSQENVEEPSIPSRKKNHITYLAYKAKINEQDLKNQWSLNKMTRQETRAKYGF